MIGISEAPNNLGTYRYDVRVRGSSSHGFRRTPNEAKSAALEDQGLMYLCARVETEDDADASKPRVRRERRDRRERED